MEKLIVDLKVKSYFTLEQIIFYHYYTINKIKNEQSQSKEVINSLNTRNSELKVIFFIYLYYQT